MRRLRVPVVSPWLRWGLVLTVALALLVASISPTGSGGRVLGPFGLLGLTTWLHVIGYAGLALVLGYALVDAPTDRFVLVALVAAAGYGLLIECVQFFLAHRTFDLWDAAANAVGAAVAAGAWRIVVVSDAVRLGASEREGG